MAAAPQPVPLAAPPADAEEVDAAGPGSGSGGIEEGGWAEKRRRHEPYRAFVAALRDQLLGPAGSETRRRSSQGQQAQRHSISQDDQDQAIIYQVLCEASRGAAA